MARTDGSRWIAVFPVSNEWKHVVLTPSDFKYWESAPDRGFPGDSFKPENAAGMSIGLAWTHTGLVGGRHEYFIDELGTAKNPYGEAPIIDSQAPVIEGFSPAYKFYPLADVAKLCMRQPFPGGDDAYPLPESMQAHHPRPTGKGFKRGRAWRWIPILEALGPKGEWRGAPASMTIDFEGSNQGSVRAAYSVQDADWYKNQSVLHQIGGTINRMARGVFFREAGAENYTIRKGETVHLGAAAANLSKVDAAQLRVVFELVRKGSSEVLKVEPEPFDLPAGENRTITCNINPPKNGADFTVTVRLLQGNETIDAIQHELAVYEPKPENQRAFMTARDGDFYLNGKKWYANGVNYMPATGIGVNDQDYFEHWIGGRAYDPEFIQRDLERCRDMGLNAGSIFIYHQSIGANNLLDILHRCEKLGIKVNLSIRPGTPMAYQWEQWKETIEHYRLWENDTIFAYDIAWEPFFGMPDQRRKYDPEWRQWIARRYGSIEAAEKAWGRSRAAF